MSHRRFTHPFRRGPRVGALMVAAICGGARLAHAQAPPAPHPPTTAASTIAPYRPPRLALVQPLDGGMVHQDRPVIVFRFAPGEPSDPIDVGSFAVLVDGVDRGALFQRAAGEAWGPIAPVSGADSPAPGAHRVSARVCSARGACTAVQATVNVLPALIPAASAPAAPVRARQSRKQRLLDAALGAARRLLVP